MPLINVAVANRATRRLDRLAVSNVNGAVLWIGINEDVAEVKLVKHDFAKGGASDILGVAGQPNSELLVDGSYEAGAVRAVQRASAPAVGGSDPRLCNLEK